MQSSEMFISLAVFGFAGFILYLFAARDRARIRYRAEVQKELIAKFSSQELAEFLNSDAGRMLIRGPKEEVTTYKPSGPPKTAKEIVGVTMAWGVLILAVGGGIYATRGLTLASSVMLALGVGFEVNAGLGYFFSKKWGSWDAPAATNATRTNGS